MPAPDNQEKTSGNAISRYVRTHTNPAVFGISVVIILAFLIAGLAFTDATSSAAAAALEFITTNFGWFYILIATFFLVFVLAVMLSRYGRLRLGPDDSRPQYRTLPWFAMLFTAGMGIGLVFFGVYEAPFHMQNAPIAATSESQAATEAMSLTIFHWGLHPWAIYIVLGMSMGYFCFRRNLPLRPAAGFYPLIGDRIYGWVGNLIDILAVFGTLFGLSTSLGFGAQQVNAGLEEVFGIPINPTVQVLIIALITAIAVVSVMLGIDRGIRRLSVLNLGLAVLLMVIIFAVGPKLYIFTGLANYTGFYLQNLVGTSFEVFHPQTQSQAASWQAGWTLFYWGWWMSWSPFVGMFIARISYGRTLRQFIGGTLLAPVAASIVWFSVLGGTGLYYQLAGRVDIGGSAPEQAMFLLVNELPLGTVAAIAVSLLTVLVVTLFFATSSDSGSLVVDMLTNGGDPHPIRAQRLFWAVTEGAVAAVLLWVGGSTALDALQAASIAAGLPFAVVLLFLSIGLSRALYREPVAAAPSAAWMATTAARRHDLSEHEPISESRTSEATEDESRASEAPEDKEGPSSGG
ncbi:choline/glycine/proline betaine transport protein [Lipingzhangella halophila]|uniref:Choline/glycine/proline betaine transport protein n=1 Tax=Lipingzhangella halophila TaxID=1783352 RepID=A0A7W7VZW1_9ACTN|nr:BCCT family transporter [Lipingzhangella halophila]MBB4929247.1 choline/glycine/proline betaine transport protein [Lipingzhangella halophila]